MDMSHILTLIWTKLVISAEPDFCVGGRSQIRRRVALPRQNLHDSRQKVHG